MKTIILALFLLTGISYGQDSTQLSQITLLGIPAGGSIPKVRTLVQTEWNGGNYYGWEFVSNANDEYIAFTWFHGAPPIAGRSNIDISEHNFDIRSDLILRTYVEYPEPTVAIVYAYAGTSEDSLIEIGNFEIHDGVGVIAKEGYPADPSVPFWPYGGGRQPGMLFHGNSSGTTERPLFKLFKDGYPFGSDEADMYVGTFNTPLATYDTQYRDARDGYYVQHLLLNGDGTVKMDGNYNGGFSFYREDFPTSLEPVPGLPDKFELSQNYPNPFNPSTRIQYQVSSISYVSLVVYDILGNEVATLVNEEKAPGVYEVEFSAATLSGSVSAKGGYASGVYIYRLNVSDFSDTKKIILLK